MSELEGQRELKGFGGWLVLFQIYIIMAVLGGIESVLHIIVTNSTPVVLFFEPYYRALAAAMFGLSLACMVLFYCKRMAFRPVFMIYGVVSIMSGLTYAFFKTSIGFAGKSEYVVFIGTLVNTLSLIFMAQGMGTIVAIVVALYKSRRVKNTFYIKGAKV